MKNIAIAVLAMAMLASLAACNTIQGAGADVSAAGHAISKAAEKAKSGN